MARSLDPSIINLALPKGRMQQNVLQLLSDAGYAVRTDGRGYRPHFAINGFDAKILKPQNIVEMLHVGSRDVGFAGADWVRELNAELIELLDTGFDPVRLVAAAPDSSLVNGRLPDRRLVIASEYENITGEWIEQNQLDARFVRSFGATEVFPPEDADCIIDNTATGTTLSNNQLVIVDDLMRSSTRFYANPRTLENPIKREAIDRFVMLLRSVLEARRRVMLEVNIPAEQIEPVIAALPAMRQPTIASLHGSSGFAVKAAVLRDELPRLIPEIKARGGCDIVVSDLSQIVP